MSSRIPRDSGPNSPETFKNVLILVKNCVGPGSKNVLVLVQKCVGPGVYNPRFLILSGSGLVRD